MSEHDLSQSKFLIEIRFVTHTFLNLVLNFSVDRKRKSSNLAVITVEMTSIHNVLSVAGSDTRQWNVRTNGDDIIAP